MDAVVVGGVDVCGDRSASAIDDLCVGVGDVNNVRSSYLTPHSCYCSALSYQLWRIAPIPICSSFLSFFFHFDPYC